MRQPPPDERLSSAGRHSVANTDGVPDATAYAWPRTGDAYGRVRDPAGEAVHSALIRIEPYAMERLADAAGRFTFEDLHVPNDRCRWVTITVSKPGFGRLRTIDNPLFEGVHYADLTLRSENQELYQGPPRASREQGERYCVR
jgi:hypothetical protein